VPDKKREKQQLEILKRTLPDFPVGSVEWQETPDCIVHGESRSIGIELTTYHHPPTNGERSFTEVRSLTIRVVDIARRKFMDAGGPALYVTVHFRNEPGVSKANAQAISDALVLAVQRTNLPKSLNEGRTDVSWELLPEEIATISIYASVHENDCLWYAGGGGWVTPIQVSHIEEVINRKNKMHEVASTKCDEVWLVIVTDMWRAAPIELSDSVALEVDSRPFDRALWFEPHLYKAWVLGTPTVFRAKGYGTNS
jgi:hypothetical protein